MPPTRSIIVNVPVKTPLETARVPLAGTDVVITRKGWISHVRGVKYVGTPAGATPTNAELASGAAWTRVWDKKDIRVVKLVCKLA